MKYEITYKRDMGEDKTIIEADRIETRVGDLYLVSGQDPDEHIHAIFSTWLRVIEVGE